MEQVFKLQRYFTDFDNFETGAFDSDVFDSIFLDDFSFQVVQFQLWVDWKRVREKKIRQSMSAECVRNSEKVDGKSEKRVEKRDTIS